MYIDALLRLDPYPEELTSDLGIPDMVGETGAAVGFVSFHHRKLYKASYPPMARLCSLQSMGASRPCPPHPRALWGAFLIAPVFRPAFGSAFMPTPILCDTPVVVNPKGDTHEN
jgi:hypothetical protein